MLSSRTLTRQSRDRNIIKVAAADYAKTDSNLHSTSNIRLNPDCAVPSSLTTTACDTLHFQPNWPVLRAHEQIDPWLSRPPDGFKTVILLTAFPALGYWP
jgi:hypothetical protein